MTEIKKITKAEYLEMIDQLTAKGEGKVKPFGLYYLIDKSAGKDIYIGVDNSNGCMWTEEFNLLSSCKRWMRGGVA